MAAINPSLDVVGTIQIEYVLYVPSGTWIFTDLVSNTVPFTKTVGTYMPVDRIVIPIDLLTAARLRLIHPGDDSGVTDEQWAWIKLLGLTGESK